MTKSEFDAFLEATIPDYAQEHVAAGNWSPEDALRLAREQFQQLLPEGLASPNQYLSMIEDEATGARVGILWFAVRGQAPRQSAFVYDVQVFPEHRRHGYASAAFRALEERVRELGLATISLHVFGGNDAARAMYRKLGYAETNVMMSKTLS
jgi:ribosomal protein S18 acetylase RimI-like enzyme